MSCAKTTASDSGCRTNVEEECEELPEPSAIPYDSEAEPLFYESSPCAPPARKAKQANDGGSVHLQPSLPPVDATVVKALETVQEEAEEQEFKASMVAVEEDNSSQPTFEFEPGSGSGCRARLWCARQRVRTLKMTAEKIEVTWKMKLGPWVCQIHYGKPGLQVGVQPTESAEPKEAPEPAEATDEE